MRYQGRDALWAYGFCMGDEAFPVVIVPYDRIVAQVDEAKAYVLDMTVTGLKATGWRPRC